MSNKMTNINKKKRFVFPLPGQRILKTMIAVFVCLLIYILRGFRGDPGESIITAIICMQPYKRDSKESAFGRLEGTVIGAIWGLIFIAGLSRLPDMADHMDLVYILMALGVGLVLYTTVVLKLTDASCLAAIVFVCIALDYPHIEAPILSALVRIADVTIGVLVSMAVNEIHLPRRKHPERVFFVRLEDLVEDRYAQVQPKVLIELNRLYDEGAHICLETKWAPAFLMSQMGWLNINMPTIVMDGAAVYDIRENSFLDVNEIDRASVRRLLSFFDAEGRGQCIFAIRDDVMMTFLRGGISVAEAEEYRIMKRSPYRNYVKGDFHEEDKIAMIRVLVEACEADAFERRVYPMLGRHMRMVRRDQPGTEGIVGFYFTSRDADLEHAENKIMEEFVPEAKADNLVSVRIRPWDDFYTPSHDAPALLHRLKDEYMPYRGISSDSFRVF